MIKKTKKKKDEKIRAFVSIDLPKKLHSEIKKIQRKLPAFKGKFIEQENIHLTLKFLGEIDKEILIEVKRRLKEIMFKEFETEITKIGIFDNTKSRHFNRKIIVWLHISNCGELQKAVDEKLEGIFSRETRFMSHLTIARVKKINDKNKFIGELKKIKLPKLKFKVKEFKLKKSKLFPKGPVYGAIERYKLI